MDDLFLLQQEPGLQSKPHLQNPQMQERKRKQYQSCDLCRRRRRACDAANLGVNPFSSGETVHASRAKACSGCQESQKQCTFEWLRDLSKQRIPQRLPMGIKRKMKTPFRQSQQPDGDDRESAGLHPSASAKCQPIAQSHDSVYDLYYALCARLNPIELLYEEQSSGLLYRDGAGSATVESDEASLFTHHITTVSSSSSSNPVLSDSYFCDLQGYVSLTRTRSPQVNLREGFTTSHNNATSTPLLSSQPPDDSPISSSDSLPRHTNLDSHLIPRASATQSPSMDFEFFEIDEEVGAYESRLGQSTNKSLIISGLMQIYNNGLETSIACWSSEDNCPYEKLQFNPAIPFKSPPSSSTSMAVSLLQRVCQLDNVFAPFNRTPLTAAANAGASRALKLAIMAFASQWSHSSQALHSGTSPLRKNASISTNQEDMTDSYEFEYFLRQSLWNEAQACLRRWSGSNSFRYILAMIIFSLTQKPLNDDEFNELQNTWGPTESLQQSDNGSAQHATDDIASRSPDSLTVPPSTESVQNNLMNPRTWEEIADAKGRAEYFGVALQQLTAWRPIIQACFAQTMLACQTTQVYLDRDQRTRLQACSNFNILFWLGVMCDTAASVLTQRPPVLADEDTEFDLQSLASRNTTLPPRVPSNNNPNAAILTESVGVSLTPALWGSFMLDLQKHNPVSFRNCDPWFSERAGRVLQDTIPVQVLLWRKTSNLQVVLTQETSPAMVERRIGETLQVYHYWNTKYGDFFKNCLSMHVNLPFKIQSWYNIQALHWHVACLRIARCIEQIDEQAKSENLQRAVRRSSAFVLELEKDSAFSIAHLAQASCQKTNSYNQDKGDDTVHPVVSHGALLTEPWTEVLHESLMSACKVLLSWLSCLRFSPIPATADSIWVLCNINSRELLQLSNSCVDALQLLGRKSDLAKLTAKALRKQINNLSWPSPVN